MVDIMIVIKNYNNGNNNNRIIISRNMRQNLHTLNDAFNVFNKKKKL